MAQLGRDVLAQRSTRSAGGAASALFRGASSRKPLHRLGIAVTLHRMRAPCAHRSCEPLALAGDCRSYAWFERSMPARAREPPRLLAGVAVASPGLRAPCAPLLQAAPHSRGIAVASHRGALHACTAPASRSLLAGIAGHIEGEARSMRTGLAGPLQSLRAWDCGVEPVGAPATPSGHLYPSGGYVIGDSHPSPIGPGSGGVGMK